MRFRFWFALLCVLAILAMVAAPMFAQTRVCDGNQCRWVLTVQWLNVDEFLDGGKVYARDIDGVFREKTLIAPKVSPPKVETSAPLPTGVVKEKCAREESYSVNGRKVEKSAVVQALVGDKQSPDSLVDDSADVVIAVFAPTIDESRKVKDELRGKLGDSGFRYWHGTPGDWAGTPSGFKTDGKPTIYCEAPSGKVLHRQDDYDGGAEAAVGAIRKAKADYDPAKDPDRRRADLPLSLPGGSFNWLTAIVLGGLFFFLTRAKPATPTAG